MVSFNATLLNQNIELFSFFLLRSVKKHSDPKLINSSAYNVL